MIKELGLGTLVGESPNELLNGYGDAVSFVLPNSHLNAIVSSCRFLEPTSETHTRRLMPDYLVRPSVEDIVSGRNVAGEFVLELIKAEAQEQEDPAQTVR